MAYINRVKVFFSDVGDISTFRSDVISFCDNNYVTEIQEIPGGLVLIYKFEVPAE